MLTHKKVLSLEELEAQTLVELPDRELMHAGKGSKTTTTTVIACSQSVSHANNALLQLIPILVPINVPLFSCDSVAF
jgi:hypothetical protein